MNGNILKVNNNEMSRNRYDIISKIS